VTGPARVGGFSRLCLVVMASRDPGTGIILHYCGPCIWVRVTGKTSGAR